MVNVTMARRWYPLAHAITWYTMLPFLAVATLFAAEKEETPEN
jgi:hypothetical protein